MPAPRFNLVFAFLVLTGPGAHALAADDKPFEPETMAIPAGSFTMGSNYWKSTSPERAVQVKAFRMGKYEVTVREFGRFVNATGYRAPRQCIQMAGNPWFASMAGSWNANTLSRSRYEPVTCIGPKDAEAYLAWMSKETGKKYRLPTEAEWEYAHRAGSTRKYPFGNNEELACRYGNIADRSAEAAFKRDYDGLDSKSHVGVAPCDDKSEYASIVGMYEPNAFGLHDTLGNVSEFVQDCFKPGYTGAPADGSAAVEAKCVARVNRGGNWHWEGWAAYRRGDMPEDLVGALEGFRVALDVDDADDVVATAATSEFAAELADARQKERDRRSQRAAIKAD
ncbi:formylglycine-generating enzyme family protein [Massilia sp. Dwa41.01b]|uniref:formylglycine-generating enzyme family protein n=1 Tax=unclassified Massilia TaxID=2609279 RepID=UPI0015FF13C8|nr:MULTISPECIES: SUMF1/EgtB/PvdO family nonheme iron enzyme [unclassified Massilia]QNA89944.1 formylglycine-generating enzyme family protein [Massilia sp. Dwa41.01b]QNB00827.1 formylglycine-generating enzyme family protein [Massilia sp. Se16.2.3]